MSETVRLVDETGAEYEVQNTAEDAVSINGQSFSVIRSPDRSLQVGDEPRITAWAVPDGDRRWVYLDGRVYVLEANPNPNLAYGEDFAESAEKSGVSYEKLLERILALGLRWVPERTG